MRIHESRKREVALKTRNDELSARVSDSLEETQQAFEQYRQSRTQYEAELKAFYERHLDTMAQAAAAAAATASRRRKRRNPLQWRAGRRQRLPKFKAEAAASHA